MSGYRSFFFRQYVKVVQLADLVATLVGNLKAAVVDHGLVGIASGLGVSQRYIGTSPSPNLSVDIEAGSGYDETGARLVNVVRLNVDCTHDHLGVSTWADVGTHRCVSIFARWVDVATEAHTDGGGTTVYRKHDDGIEFAVYQGSETAVADPLDLPPLMTGWLLLADITIINAQTQIVTADISFARTQYVAGVAGTPHTLARRTLPAAVADLLGWVNDLELPPGAAVKGDGTHPQVLYYHATQLWQPLLFVLSPIWDPDSMVVAPGAPKTLSNVDYTNDEYTSAGHGLVNGDRVYFSSSGNMPTGLSAYAVYYVVDRSNNTFKVSRTVGGPVQDISDAGTGSRYVYKASTKVTLLEDGVYDVSLYLKLAADAAAAKVGSGIRIAGTTVVGDVLPAIGDAGLAQEIQRTWTLPLSAGDWFEPVAFATEAEVIDAWTLIVQRRSSLYT